MKRRFCLIPAAITLVCIQAAFANDIENAINKYGGKIGIKGSAANLINSQIRSVNATGAANSAAASATGAGLNSTTTTTTNTTTTTRANSLKNALQNVFSKSKTAATTINTNTATGDINQLNTSLPVAVPPGTNLAPKKQSVKAKIGKEIWRQANRYEAKHPNKLMRTGVNSLNKAVGQP
ncbi:hypothetical protein KBI23_04770 [bacterium]|nr:hypothetical protein [bacterium]MBP9807207.1 hypothetical protein [bacterium]